MLRSLIVLGIASFFPLFLTPAFGETGPSDPNILLIITDDQRYDDLEDYMPKTYGRIFSEGKEFPNAYTSTPSCCPSRAGILTGLYARNNRVLTNRDELRFQTVVESIRQQKGYYTGMIGKYLNSWSGEARPEFKYWASWGFGWRESEVGQLLSSRTMKLLEDENGEFVPPIFGRAGLVRTTTARRAPSSLYSDPVMNVNGEWQQEQGYSTDIFDRHAQEYFSRAFSQDEPFLLIASFNGPHYPAIPHPDHASLFLEDERAKPPSFNRPILGSNRSTSPLKGLQKSTLRFLEEFRIRQRQCLASIDRSVERILQKIEEQGKLDDTIIIYLSDNGLLFGEHRSVLKGHYYQESIRLPFAIRYPKRFGTGQDQRLIANIDIAPTLYDLTDTKPPYELDGFSLLPSSSGETNSRKQLFFQGPKSSFFAVHTGRYVLATRKLNRQTRARASQGVEFFDLQANPFQRRNLVNQPRYRRIAGSLLRRLKDFRYSRNRAASPKRKNRSEV